MTLDQIESAIKSKMALAHGLNAKILFDFGDDGLISVDATQSPPIVGREEFEADTTLKTSLDTFSAILEGRQDPNVAFMLGKLKVKGSMGLAMKLNGILED